MNWIGNPKIQAQIREIKRMLYVHQNGEVAARLTGYKVTYGTPIAELRRIEKRIVPSDELGVCLWGLKVRELKILGLWIVSATAENAVSLGDGITTEELAQLWALKFYRSVDVQWVQSMIETAEGFLWIAVVYAAYRMRHEEGQADLLNPIEHRIETGQLQIEQYEVGDLLRRWKHECENEA